MKLGSLFDGSGGFPLAGVLNDIEPVWASEIEPYPLKVTATRFPNMKQLGDITKIDGTEIEPVDIITFGSPCQDLSIAGGRDGIHNGARSNLFFEAIRIIKEMRGKTNGKYPRFAVWENVPGAFSSNHGEDFRFVLEAFAGVCGDDISIPRPPKNKWCKRGGWQEMDGHLPGGSTMLNTGEYPNDARESILSQILQANAPQKYYLSARACQGILNRAKKRGKAIPPILKEALEEVVMLSKNAQANQGGKGLLPAIDRAFTLSTNVDQSICYRNAGFAEMVEGVGTLRTSGGDIGGGLKASSLNMFENHSQDSRYTGPLKVSQTVSATFGTGGNNTPFVVEKHEQNN